VNIYDFEVENIKNEVKKMSDYKGKVLLIVNTASKCGFTPQFEGLEDLYTQYQDKGLEILGFPCNQFLNQDPGSNDKIMEFCQVNYGVSFDMFAKIKVNGKSRHPLYQYLIENSPERTNKRVKWNFEKFLINRHGEVVNRYASTVVPEDLKDDIEVLL
jgi:glutathione peroxidase